MSEQLEVVDVVHAPSGSTLTVRAGAHERVIELPALGPVAVESAIDQVGRQLEAGLSLDAAVAALAVHDVPHRTQRRSAVDGTLLLDDTASLRPDEIRASLKVLADLGRAGFRTIAIVGGLDVAEPDRFDEHDALGRIVVRLDIAQLVVIGQNARHLSMAASLEGSWNGESVLFDDAESAYDFVRATMGRDAVILISGGAGRTDLRALVDRLTETTA